MKFKVGDKVRVVTQTFGNCGSMGVVTGTYLDKSDRLFEVTLGPNYIIDLWGSELELVAITPPIVTATGGDPNDNTVPTLPNGVLHISEDEYPALGTIHLRDDEMSDFEAKAPKCDCGGFKTYNSMVPEVHSHWCSSRK